MRHLVTGDFAKIAMHCPVLNTPDFQAVFGGSDGSSLPLDDQGLLRAVETVLFKESKVKITGRHPRGIYGISTAEYGGSRLYIDCRFLDSAEDTTPERLKKTPPLEKVLERLQKLIGTPYIWGGNWSPGIPEMLEFYPPLKHIDKKLEDIWSLKGIDCSGLLYQVSDGTTPRNTSELLRYGRAVPIEQKSPEEILSLVKPLDIFVWQGHVVIVLDREKAIESRGGKGVITSDTAARLAEILKEKTPADNWTFKEDLVLRRWHPETRIL